MRRLPRTVWLLGVLASASLLTGCVERKYVVTTDPPGAVVYENNKPIGATPVDNSYLFYGNYHYTIVKDGYQTLQVDQEFPAPWYGYAPLDFFVENLWPWTIQDVRRLHYQLQPVQVPNVQDVIGRADELRTRGQSIGEPKQ